MYMILGDGSLLIVQIKESSFAKKDGFVVHGGTPFQLPLALVEMSSSLDCQNRSAL